MTKQQSTEVAERNSAEVAINDAEAQLIAENQGAVDAADLQIPLLKVGQALTQEVQEGEADAGEFINALTREGLGTKVEFVVAHFTKGRFFHGDRATNRRARKAFGTKTVPWQDDPHYNEPFTEHPDAEEQYSARVNNGEIEWGKGPKISTTFDFTGYVIPADPDEQPIPVCLSLMRKNKKTAQKWVTLLQAVLRGRYWDAVFEVSTERTANDAGDKYYVVNVKQGRKTTPEEKQLAIEIAQAVRRNNVEVVGEEDEAAGPKAEPDAAGGLGV